MFNYLIPYHTSTRKQYPQSSVTETKMRVPLLIISFFALLFSVSFVKGQECLREEITYENIKPVEKALYADGDRVKLTCLTGYVGLYILTCNGGHWQTLIARSCSKNKCGHPGETPNGYFKLVQGNDFTFGATVEYTCKKGYEMASRNNRRHCRIEGWDNTIPVCEEVRCPEIHTDGDVTALGNTMEGTYGDVIHFECISSDKQPDGSSVIHCMENGNWSGPIPQCIVTCLFDLTESGAIKTVQDKTLFRAGETVGLICSDKNTQFYRYEIFTCTNSGKWDYKPTCEEIKCEVPHGKHVSVPDIYFYKSLTLGTKRSYSCVSGYRKMAEVATCTRDGWTPKPLCEEIMCEPPNLQNAEIVGGQKRNYKISSIVEYKCRPGFEPEEHVQITCDSHGQWIGIKACTDGTCQEQELKNIRILFGYPTHTSPYLPGQILVFQCTDADMRFYGQRAIECQPDGRWNYPYPQCGGTVQCSTPTKNLQFVTVTDQKTMYSNFEIMKYRCKEPYNEIPEGALMCQNGQWNGTFDCKSKICPPPPHLTFGDYSTVSKTDDNVITAVSYTCQSFYVLSKQQENYKCVDGIWETPPKCLRPCEIDNFVENYNLQLPTEKVYIKHANTYRLNCKDGWNTKSDLKAHVDVSCTNGNLQIGTSCDTPSK